VEFLEKAFRSWWVIGTCNSQIGGFSKQALRSWWTFIRTDRFEHKCTYEENILSKNQEKQCIVIGIF